ncbi:hypothetical protein LCGC14_2213560, partial [marine sediment metagenome]
CDAPGERKILVVDERAIHFEKTRGVKVTQIFDYGAGRTEKREVDRRLEDVQGRPAGLERVGGRRQLPTRERAEAYGPA